MEIQRHSANSYEFLFNDSYFKTIGPMIQKEITKNNNVLFVGYLHPHPQENRYIIKIETNDGNPLDIFVDSLKKLIAKIQQIEIANFIKINDTSIANAIRKTGISRIKSLCIGSVAFIENTSNTIDEIIAHRIGLIPLINNNKDTNIDEIQMKIKKKSSKIYSKDFEFYINDQKIDFIKPVSENITIVDLNKDQEIDMVGYLESGTGYEHSKWNIVSDFIYKKENDYVIVGFESIGTIKASEIIKESIEYIIRELQKYIKLSKS